MERPGPRAALAAVAIACSGLALLTAAPPAGASCAGPTLTVQASPDAVGRLIVRGEAFGDDCHDTGSAPDGEGALGRPLTGIEVVILQGDAEHVVARGAADDDYTFEVTVTIPAELAPGEASVAARWPAAGESRPDGGRTETPAPILVSPVPPTSAPADPTTTSTTVPTFGPASAAAAPPDLGDLDELGGDGGFGPYVGHFAIGAAIGAAVTVAHRQRRHPAAAPIAASPDQAIGTPLP